MKLAIISDMHGNHVAFEAVLQNLKKAAPDQIVCLGDAVQGGVQPAEVVQTLRQERIPTVMGNSDAWLLDGSEHYVEKVSEEVKQKLEQIRNWSLDQLSNADREYIASFPPSITLDLGENVKLLCFHGTPDDCEGILLPADDDERFLEKLPTEQATYFCGGHTHVQFIRHIGRGFHFNPGSAGFAYRHGQPKDHFRADPWAEYAILTAEGGFLSLEFRRIPFDVGKMLEIARSKGRPDLEKLTREYSEA